MPLSALTVLCCAVHMPAEVIIRTGGGGGGGEVDAKEKDKAERGSVRRMGRVRMRTG